MITKDQIPKVAICHICGEPMKVVNLNELATELSVLLPKQHSCVINCCDFELTIEDNEEFQELCKILLEYHKV